MKLVRIVEKLFLLGSVVNPGFLGAKPAL